MSDQSGLRRHDRAEKAAGVQIVWKDRAGEDKFMMGNTVDVSELGIRLEVREPIDQRTYVTIQCPELGIHGTASVRSCSRRGTRFLLGLEFTGGLRWKPKQNPAG